MNLKLYERDKEHELEREPYDLPLLDLLLWWLDIDLETFSTNVFLLLSVLFMLKKLLKLSFIILLLELLTLGISFDMLFIFEEL